MCVLHSSPCGVNTFMASLALSATLSGCAASAPEHNALSHGAPPPVIFVDRATLPIAPTDTSAHAVSSPDTVMIAAAPAHDVLGGHAGAPARPGDPRASGKAEAALVVAGEPVAGEPTTIEPAVLKPTAPAPPTRCVVRPGLLADNLTRLSQEFDAKPVIWAAPFDVPIELGAEIPAQDFEGCVDSIVRSVQASQVSIRATSRRNAIVIDAR